MVDKVRMEAAVRETLCALGEDPDREGLKLTPYRVAKWWDEFMSQEADMNATTFEAVKVNQMVVVSGIRVWSVCEHHLLPFWCDVAVGYLCQETIVGLSKIPRLCRRAGACLSIQERLVETIARDVRMIAKTQDVAVVAKGRHLCTMMRGVRSDCDMTSSAISGAFVKSDVRAEFLALADRGK